MADAKPPRDSMFANFDVCCGIIPASSPKGRAGLGMRGWNCCHWGAAHDRDVNADSNILGSGMSVSQEESHPNRLVI